jgi:two-component system sensor kinase FixL
MSGVMAASSETLRSAFSSDEMQALLDAAVDGIVLIDHLGNIQAFNRAAERLFGYRAPELTGRNVSILMPESDRDAHDGHLARYLRTRVPHIIGKGREVNARHRDGSIFPVLLSVGVVPGAEPPRFVGFIQDITRRREDEDGSRRLQERLMHVSRLATVGEMASGIAHEINQPLTAIVNYAQACERFLRLPDADIDEVRGALQQIAAQAVRAGDIIKQLRSLARSHEARREPTEVNALLEELTDLIEATARAHGVSYTAELAYGLPPVLVDRTQIQQVVLNLTRNSIEALAESSTGGRLTLRTSLAPDGTAEICVCDNGPGVSEAIAPRLFHPFCTSKSAGTGLGLAMSRTIVASHGGTLDYRANVPSGACFIVRLPLASPGET